MGFLTPEYASLYIGLYPFYLKKKGQNRFLHSDQIIQILSLKSVPAKIQNIEMRLCRPPCRHGTQIMLIVHDIGRGLLERQRPVAGLGPCLDQAVRPLTEQNQDRGQNAQKRPHKQKCKPGKAYCPLLLHADLAHGLSKDQKQVEGIDRQQEI